MKAPTAATDSPTAHRSRPIRRRWMTRGRRASSLIAAGASLVAGVFDRRSTAAARATTGRRRRWRRVQRRTLSQTTQFNGTLAYAGSYTVLGQARGTVTWLPRSGQVISNGQVLYRGGRGTDRAAARLDARPTAPWRRSDRGGRDRRRRRAAQPRPGRAGIRPEADVDAAWNEFSWATTLGVQKLQNHLGMDADRPARSRAPWCSCRPPPG